MHCMLSVILDSVAVPVAKHMNAMSLHLIHLFTNTCNDTH